MRVKSGDFLLLDVSIRMKLFLSQRSAPAGNYQKNLITNFVLSKYKGKDWYMYKISRISIIIFSFLIMIATNVYSAEPDQNSMYSREFSKDCPVYGIFGIHNYEGGESLDRSGISIGFKNITGHEITEIEYGLILLDDNSKETIKKNGKANIAFDESDMKKLDAIISYKALIDVPIEPKGLVQDMIFFKDNEMLLAQKGDFVEGFRFNRSIEKRIVKMIQEKKLFENIMIIPNKITFANGDEWHWQGQ